MNWLEAKDKTAHKHGHGSWSIAEYRAGREDIDSMYTEAAELYARSKWKEACDNQMFLIARRFHDNHETQLRINSTPRPDF